MGGNAATKLSKILDNLERVLAIELMNAAQALDFRHRLADGRRSSSYIEDFVTRFRAEAVPFVDTDVVMYPLIDAATEFVRRQRL